MKNHTLIYGSYRENVGGGNITFGRAFAVGILITLISCICYVVAWEIVYFNFLPDFADKYAAYTVEKAKASGATQQVIDADHPPVKKSREMRSSPLRGSHIRSEHNAEEIMELGNFSVSLAVKDIEASKVFYQKLGFTVFAGDQSQNWLIMKNGNQNIGLFQGMFDKNILTFNPGWSSDAEALKDFTDVRELQRQLKASGIDMITEADENSTGPASFMIADPDGNTILVDQHV